MLIRFVMTVISDDKPGIIETLAQLVSQSGGSWLESNFSQLAGKFAGVVCLQIDKREKHRFLEQLAELKEQGIHIQVETNTNNPASSIERKFAQFSAIGPDKKGIVKEFSQAFVAKGINIESMETQLSSAPHSGEALFEARGNLSLPANTEFEKIESTLYRIADELGLDFSLQI